MTYADSSTHDTNFVCDYTYVTWDYTYVTWMFMLMTYANPYCKLGVPPGAPRDVHRTIINVKSSMLRVPPGAPWVHRNLRLSSKERGHPGNSRGA